MCIVISNQYLSVTIIPKNGALVSSIIHFTGQNSGTEILHPSESHNSSNGGIPILFPFAGRNWSEGKVNNYNWNNHIYKMPIHGFISNKRFDIISRSASETTLKLQENKSTLAIYPWKFDLVINYKLVENTLNTTMIVTNQDSKPMPIAPGYHPYFKLNFFNSDHINLRSKKAYSVTKDGNSGKQKEISDSGELTNTIYHNLIVKNRTNSSEIFTKSKTISIYTDDIFKYWVLWAKVKQNFFCLEPWTARPNSISNYNELIILESGERKTLSCQIEVKNSILKRTSP